jgi:type IV secretory pathway TrbD component
MAIPAVAASGFARPEEDAALRRIALHRAMNRPSLLLGGERELVLMTGLMAAVLIFASATVATALAGGALWVLVVGGLRMMARADPCLSRVYLRHIRYQRYYPARATPFRN